MMRLIPLAGALLATTLCAHPRAQQVTGLVPDEGTLGTVVRVSVDDVPNKPKPVLVQDGAIVKKTKLKVVDTGPDYIDVSIHKAPAGSFDVGFKAKGNSASGVGASPLMVLAPQVLSAAPDVSQPGDVVDVLVSHAGAGKLKAQVGLHKAKVTAVTPAGGDGVDAQSVVTIIVPKKIPNGVWPVTISNAVGAGALKGALTITNSDAKPLKPGAIFDVTGDKPVKAKEKNVSFDDDVISFEVVAFSGNKKNVRTVTLAVPKAMDELVEGDSFGPGDDGANIVVAGQGNQGVSSWFADAGPEFDPCGDWSIDVLSVTEDGIISLGACGCLVRVTGNGLEQIEISGVITFDSNAEIDTGAGQPCAETMTALGGTTGPFVSDDETPSAWYGLSGPNILKIAASTPLNFDGPGEPFREQLIDINVAFNPETDATPVTFDSLALFGPGLQSFNLEIYDGVNPVPTFWVMGIDPVTLATTMSVTIESYTPAGPNPLSVKGCIKGSFSGTLQTPVGPPTQSFSGEFELPWYDFGIGG